MITTTVHKEDVKAAIRKKFGSIAAFERKFGLPAESVSDVLRGRSVRRTAQAVANELSIEIQGCAPSESVTADDSAREAAAHRIKAVGR